MIREVAVGILMKKGEVLVCQRPRTARYALKWEFPGGKLEPGESAREALDRELHEELGIHVLAAEEFHRQEWIYPEGLDDPTSDGAFRVYYFHIRSYAGAPQNSLFEQIRWVPLAKLQELDILEGNRDAVVLLVRHGADERG